MKLLIDNQTIKYDGEPPLIVSGSVGLYWVEFEFSDDWNGFSKTIIFAKRYGDESISQILEGDSMVIPAGIIDDTHEFIVGVYGVKGGLIKPTLWSKPLFIEEGCYESNTIPDPEHSVYTQIMSILSDCINNTEALLETDPFVVTFTYNGVTILSNKTADELFAAYQAGKYILAKLITSERDGAEEHSVGFSYIGNGRDKQFKFYFAPIVRFSNGVLSISANRDAYINKYTFPTTREVVTYNPVVKQVEVI